MKHKKAILIFGPTASGKSRLALDIAEKFSCEIINADSMQVYKEIKILSARPNNYKNIRHHLYGFISAKENFSVGAWYELASNKIKDINKKGKIAIVVGGTGLYFKVLIDFQKEENSSGMKIRSFSSTIGRSCSLDFRSSCSLYIFPSRIFSFNNKKTSCYNASMYFQ